MRKAERREGMWGDEGRGAEREEGRKKKGGKEARWGWGDRFICKGHQKEMHVERRLKFKIRMGLTVQE